MSDPQIFGYVRLQDSVLQLTDLNVVARYAYRVNSGKRQSAAA